MKAKLLVKEKAILLRREGFSLNEIHAKLNISKSSASLWLKNIKLNDVAQERIKHRRLIGRMNSVNTRKLHNHQKNKIIEKNNKIFLRNFLFTKKQAKVLCAIIYWCEGGKLENGSVRFTNSDPLLVKLFLRLFRRVYKIDESKLRALVHLHHYHSVSEQHKFWSKITKIPLDQFNKPYQKQNGGKRIRAKYQGCISIRYYDSQVYKNIISLAQLVMQTFGGVG